MAVLVKFAALPFVVVALILKVTLSEAPGKSATPPGVVLVQLAGFDQAPSPPPPVQVNESPRTLEAVIAAKVAATRIARPRRPFFICRITPPRCLPFSSQS